MNREVCHTSLFITISYNIAILALQNFKDLLSIPCVFINFKKVSMTNPKSPESTLAYMQAPGPSSKQINVPNLPFKTSSSISLT